MLKNSLYRASPANNNQTVKYIKNCLHTIAGISLASLVACSEERPATEQELIVAMAWLECAQQEKWDEVYNQSGFLGKKIGIQNECGEEPPYVPDD